MLPRASLPTAGVVLLVRGRLLAAASWASPPTAANGWSFPLRARQRDRGWSHYLDSISVVPFAFMSCSVVPFAKRDRGNGAMIMVPTVVPFALLCSIAAKCSKLFERFAAKCSNIFGLCSPYMYIVHSNVASFIKCRGT